ncbi:hypothetical protein AKJ65_01435 [candidate division MSBL1 archaeon SCGC-AAA259E19]|uniref:Major facilitator superfamily (MFS) profile domain-containing protein n=1 Tax=candidate division MSBL1 archaeon SCGC-AAA259E19 TaxID=1698264 RepID=A0A133UN23_9EURY|nr:hypothetical protein AKJ65_01435 [candidate division MSBL1 archaeon SCGC-AAA259E19]
MLKLIFGVSAMAMSVFLVFSRIYFKEAGLSNGEIGVLLSIPGFILVFSQPLWSVLTDYFGSAKRMFQIMVGGSALFLFIYYIGADFFLTHFLALMVLFVAFSLFYTGRGPTRNSMTLTHLDKVGGDNRGFGGVRLWFSIGWAVCSVIVGWFFLENSLLFLFPISAGLFGLTALLVFLLPETERAQLQGVNIFQDPQVRKILKNREVLIYLVALFVLGVGTLASATFLPIYLKESFKVSTLSLGAFYAVGALAEVPFFHYGDELLAKFGIRKFIITGFTVQSLIWIVLGLVTIPAVAFLVWILRGFGWSLIYLGSVLYLDWNSPEEARTVGQGIYMTTFFGFSAIVGRLGGGFISEWFGLGFLYLLSGALGLVGVGILIFYWLT